MMMRGKWVHVLIVGAGICLLRTASADEATGASDATSAAGTTVVQALSQPSSKHNLSFTDEGVLKDLLVKPGDVVTTGQVLAEEDSDLDELDYKAAKIEAESTSKVDGAKVARDEKERIYQNKEKAFESGGAANQEEVEEAKLEYQEAEIDIRLAQEQHDEKMAELAKMERKIDKMKLLSPVDGIVEKINTQPGEVVDPAKPDGAITVVKTNPLWVDMHLSLEQASKLKMGDKLSATYANDPDQWFTGTVIYFDPVVDATVDQQTVRLEVDNGQGKPAGMLLNVRIP
jgi:RND family efflux transporter MFP subunit